MVNQVYCDCMIITELKMWIVTLTYFSTRFILFLCRFRCTIASKMELRILIFLSLVAGSLCQYYGKYWTYTQITKKCFLEIQSIFIGPSILGITWSEHFLAYVVVHDVSICTYHKSLTPFCRKSWYSTNWNQLTMLPASFQHVSTKC